MKSSVHNLKGGYLGTGKPSTEVINSCSARFPSTVGSNSDSMAGGVK